MPSLAVMNAPAVPPRPPAAPPPVRSLRLLLALHVAMLAGLWLVADVIGAVLELSGRADSALGFGQSLLVLLGLGLDLGLVVALVVLSIQTIARARGRLLAVGISVLVLSVLPGASGSVATGDFADFAALIGQPAATIWALVIGYDLLVLLAVTAGCIVLWRITRSSGPAARPA